MLRDNRVVKFAGKVATQSATAVLATLIGGYFLTMLNLRTPAESSRAPEPAASDDRALTREYVKSLREGGREAAAEVRPTAPPAETVVAKGAVAPPADAPLPAARKESRIRTDVATAPASPLPTLGTPIELAPAKVAEADAEDPRNVAPHRGGTTVFSVLSGIIGTAANVTGDSINFVIDLPGRALRGGRDAPAASTGTPRAAQPPAAEQPPMRFVGS